MGVPKFYRWISERYPCLSEVVKEFQLPEFDNLYLDMNGIIHVCSHPDDDNPHFRITEEKIFTDICHYIDFLFRMIKPRKVFFMAVDGVAPRAKMNQQRGRRFRSAREAEELIEKAKQAGETLPSEKRFDSNCITPGTPFMVRLQEHLKYFVVEKISKDPLWQDVAVYLSGHETPGEGEHKVMDYIRWSKSQPGYDGNTRHCLYGLDADLIMLGLTSHEPHFSLLREEVRFGGKRDRNKRPATPEETTFHLLHLSLMRDYLGYEFSPLKDKLSFPWDLEHLIDDWIMIGFLVGNDFIPHLPNFHIQHDALPTLWNAYMKVLPSLGGYINEGGHLNLPRLEMFFAELAKFDKKEFESAFSDLKYLESKLGGKSINESVNNAADRVKLKKLTAFKDFQDGAGVMDDENEDDLLIDLEEEDSSDEANNIVADEFVLHKRDYYMNKLHYRAVGPDVIQELAEGYVRAIQWILLYYFEGVPSWSWYYPHHYSPYISDINGFQDMNLDFDLSTPFLPFQQLMAVLPSASKELLPPALQTLMTESTSPVIDFYPVDFQSDLNGKQQSWEAVVLIPFIDEERLLAAMRTKEHFLTHEERSRNCHGPHLVYTYTSTDLGFFPSTLPGKCPDIHSNRAKCTKIRMDTFRIDGKDLKKGLGITVDLNVYYPGFPTLFHLPHTHELKNAGVKVFQQSSRNSSVILHVNNKPDVRLEELADEILGKTIFVGWPHIHEARVVALANESFKIELLVETGRNAAVSFNRRKLGDVESQIVAREATTIKERLMSRFAIDVGDTEIIVYASPMTGRTYTYGTHGNITLDKQFASHPVPLAYQMTIKELQVKECVHTIFETLEDVFPQDSTIFMLGTPHYGAQGKVLEVLSDSARVRIALDVTVEPDLQQLGHLHMKDRYLTAYEGAQLIGVDTHILSRITGSVFVEKAGQNSGRANVGLNLKFTKREEEVPGYTRKEENGWTYSRKCIETVEQYVNKFPQLWRRISAARSTSDVFVEDDLFPKEGSSKLSDVTKFLEELPSSKAPKMKFGSEILDSEQVARIESMTASVTTKKPMTVKMKIKPRLLFRPLTDLGSIVPDPQTDFLLYDRVVVVKSGYSVPFGKRGTIIGIPSEEGGALTPHSVYDVVFDEPFVGGITLRCSASRGYRVPGSAMLNITYGEFRKNRPVSERPTAGVWNRGRNDKQRMAGLPNSNNSNLGGRNLSQGKPGAKQPVMWDNKGQPLFGQVFAGNVNASSKQGMAQPKFVTPKVQAPQQVLGSKVNMKTDSVDFNNIWKTLQNQNVKGGESTSLPSSVQNPRELKGQSSNQSPGPTKILSKNQSDKPSVPQAKQTIPLVQSLFANPSKTGPQASGTENAEFMAMFNSLKLQTEQQKSLKSAQPMDRDDGSSTLTTKEAPKGVASMEQRDAKAKEADNAIKQMLKIGMPASGSPSLSPKLSSSTASTNPATSSTLNTASSYGRQVSLKELFDGANRQLKPQQKEEKSKPGDVKVLENKDPMKELEAYCAANGLTSPHYDYKHQPKQMSFIANVMVQGRGRYEGSLCPNKVEAAKSAASIALLCLKSKANPPNIMAPFIPGIQRPGLVHPLFSHNSAFSPIGLPGQPSRVPAQQPDLMRPPPLLTPQHFITQPPPLVTMQHQSSHHPLPIQPHPLNMPHQHPPPNIPLQHPNPMFEQLQQQLQQLANDFQKQQMNQGINIAAAGNRPPQQVSKTPEVPSSTTGIAPSSTSSSVQPFIPLQVSRNQKTPKNKKDVKPNGAESDRSALTTSTDMKKIESSVMESPSEVNSLKTNAAAGNQNEDRLSEKDFGFTTQPFSPNGLQREELSTAKTTLTATDAAVSPSLHTSESDKKEKPAMPKKKSRLAANFGKKNAGPSQQSLSQTK